MGIDMTAQFAKLLRIEFTHRLKAKTGWGRNDIMIEYDQAVSAVVLRMLDESTPVKAKAFVEEDPPF